MKRFLILFVVPVLTIFFGMTGFSASAAAQPSGSYQQSCDVISNDSSKMTMTANCMRKKTSFSGAHEFAMNYDFSYKYCAGDITNNDGVLACAFNQAKYDAEQAAAAKSAAFKAAVAKSTSPLQSASNVVLGRKAGQGEISNWVQIMQQANSGLADKVAAGLSYLDAVNFLKTRLATDATLRAKTIANVFDEVHGRQPSATEQASYDAQLRNKALWYATAVAAEQNKLKADAALKSAVITRAHQTALGRLPNRDELLKWSREPGDYRQFVEKLRAWLYSPAGSTELVETVKRALGAKRKPNGDALVKAALVGYSQKSAIYREM